MLRKTGAAPFTTTFAATPDLSLAAYAIGLSNPQRFRVIDLRDGRELWTAGPQNGEAITALAFSPDGKILASAALGESNIRLWDVATGKQTGELEGHGSWVSSIVFWPDGKKMASGSGDQTIRIWDVAEQKCLDVLRGHRLEVWRLALLPDDKTLVSGCKDGTVCFWDASVKHPHQARITFPKENIFDWLLRTRRSLLLDPGFAGSIGAVVGCGLSAKNTVAGPGDQCLFGLLFTGWTFFGARLDQRNHSGLEPVTTGFVASTDQLSRKSTAANFSRRWKEAVNPFRKRSFVSRMGSCHRFGNPVVAATGGIDSSWHWRRTNDRACTLAGMETWF